MAEITALEVRVDGTVEVKSIEPELETLQAMVGGYIEGVTPPHGRWTAYVDEEGLLKGLPLNRRATVMARQLGAGDVILVGPAVFLGPADDEGYDTDVTAEVLASAGTTDLPPGYRWAQEGEESRPDAVVVKRTADVNGVLYAQDEADLAVPREV